MPFADESVNHVYSAHCLEHVVAIEYVLAEIIRICTIGAHVEIRTPHWFHNSAMCPDHKHVVNRDMVDVWANGPRPNWIRARRRASRFATPI